MEDDFIHLRNHKETLFQATENAADIEQTPSSKPDTKVRFIITKNKNNSWVDDLHAQAQLNLIKRVYH